MPLPLNPEWIAAAQQGSSQAFRWIVESQQSMVYRVAYRFVGHAAEAEDITQEVFVSLWKSIGQYRSDVKLSTWLYRITVNRCLDFLKSGRARFQATVKNEEQATDVCAPATPETEWVQSELVEMVQKSADELPPMQKAVFVLRDLEGLSSEEVAATLQLSTGSVKSNLFHARQRIAGKLKEIYAVPKPDSL